MTHPARQKFTDGTSAAQEHPVQTPSDLSGFLELGDVELSTVFRLSCLKFLPHDVLNCST